MNPIVFALRHPITTMMLVVALVGGGVLALTRMRIDIFPPINQPQIFVFTSYGGYGRGQQFVAGMKPAVFVGAAIVDAGALLALAIGKRSPKAVKVNKRDESAAEIATTEAAA